MSFKHEILRGAAFHLDIKGDPLFGAMSFDVRCHSESDSLASFGLRMPTPMVFRVKSLLTSPLSPLVADLLKEQKFQPDSIHLTLNLLNDQGEILSTIKKYVRVSSHKVHLIASHRMPTRRRDSEETKALYREGSNFDKWTMEQSAEIRDLLAASGALLAKQTHIEVVFTEIVNMETVGEE